MKKKNLINLFCLIILAIVSTFNGYIHGEQEVNKTYSDLMIVTEVDYESGLVTLENSNGFQFQYFDDMKDDITVGEYYNVTMLDSGKQKYIYDDKIINIRYERVNMF